MANIVTRDYTNIAHLYADQAHVYWPHDTQRVALDPARGAFALVTAWVDNSSNVVEIITEYANDRQRAELLEAHAVDFVKKEAENFWHVEEAEQMGAWALGSELVELGVDA